MEQSTVKMSDVERAERAARIARQLAQIRSMRSAFASNTVIHIREMAEDKQLLDEEE